MTPTDQMEPRDLSFLLTVRFLSPWGGSMLLQHLQNLLTIQNNHSRLPSPLSFWYYAGVHTASPVSRSFLPLCRILLRTHDLIKFSHQLPDLLRICPRRRHFYPEHPHYFSPSCLTGTSVCGIFTFEKKDSSSSSYPLVLYSELYVLLQFPSRYLSSVPKL